MQCNVTRCIICISSKAKYLDKEPSYKNFFVNLSYLSNAIKKISFHRHFKICCYQIDAMKHQHKNKLNVKGASHIDFVHEQRYMDVGNGGGGGGARFSVKNRGKFRS